MTVLLIIVALLLALSALLFFGVPYMLLGRAGLAAVMVRPEAKMTGGAFASVLIMVALMPLAQAALVSSGDHAVYFASELHGLSFGM